MARRVMMISGVVLIALALVWLYLIFPGMAKFPADYEKVYHFEGTVQVFDIATNKLIPIGTKMDRSLAATGVNDAGALTAGDVPWARVSGFPGDADASNDLTTATTFSYPFPNAATSTTLTSGKLANFDQEIG